MMSNTPEPPAPADSIPNSAEKLDAPAPPPTRRWKRMMRKAAISSLILVVFAAVGLGGAEYYTARPDFCGTCHVMDPYYKSWASDKHGAEVHARCIDCHYAPGEKYTFKAKFKGLSQVASYFSGRYGAARPRAHVANASCLVSGCHGDNKFREKEIEIGARGIEERIVNEHPVKIERTPTVHFFHAKHLDSAARLSEVNAQMEAVTKRLRGQLNDEQFTEVKNATQSIEPSDSRRAGLDAVLTRINAMNSKPDATEMLNLEHMRIRLEQLRELNCTACHTYDATSDSHFSVSLNTCYTCHFTNESFNAGTGECLKCHEPPTRKFVVHGSADPTTANPAALMDHKEIVERGINCASCHFDLIRGEAVVSIRDCQRCHDSDKFMRDFEGRTTAIVEKYHRVHVAGQRAHCLDCHRSIQHHLNEPQTGGKDDFLRPVLDDCQHCHPGHHREQVEMLKGIGGRGAMPAMPNAMFGSRLNCRGCHTHAGSDFKGDPLVKATRETCVACHSTDYDQYFEQWRTEIANYQKEATDALARVEQKVAEWKTAGRSLPPSMIDAIERARANVHFVTTANGIHNKNYSMVLLDTSVRELDAALIQLAD